MHGFETFLSWNSYQETVVWTSNDISDVQENKVKLINILFCFDDQSFTVSYYITGTSINRKCIIKISKGKSWIWKKKQLFKFLNLLFFSEADKSNDMRSTDRKLDQSLLLLLKQVVDGKEWWYLPTMNYTPGLSMREVSVLGHSGCTAFRLFIALDLHVQVHCRNVNSKLNVGNRIIFVHMVLLFIWNTRNF